MRTCEPVIYERLRQGDSDLVAELDAGPLRRALESPRELVARGVPTSAAEAGAIASAAEGLRQMLAWTMRLALVFDDVGRGVGLRPPPVRCLSRPEVARDAPRHGTRRAR